MNKTTCGWLTNGVYYNPVDWSSSLKSCCRFNDKRQDRHNIKTLHDQQQWMKTNPDYNDFKNNACSSCYKEELSRGESMRTRSLAVSQNFEPGQLNWLHVTFSNFCNLKCLYCQPNNSTTWIDDSKKLTSLNINAEINQYYDHESYITSVDTYKKEKRLLEDLKSADLSSLKYIGVFGGEPFMARNFENFVSIIEDVAPDIMIQINTNCTIFPKENVLTALEKFKKVQLRFSTESVFELAEYIRHPMKWQVFDDTRVKWQSWASGKNNIQLQCHAANSIYNINMLEDFVTWADDCNLGIVNAKVFKPEYLDYSNVLNESQLLTCYNRVEKLINSHGKNIRFLEGVKSDLQSSIDNLPFVESKWKELSKTYISSIDKIRSNNLSDVNSEMYSWIFN